jgi:hypothetical protein
MLVTACSGSAGEILDDLLDDIGHGSGGGGHHHPPPPPSGSCDFVNWDQVWEEVELDILTRDAEDRVFIRYVTLANKLDAGQCGSALDDERQALSKLLNSLSRAPRIVQPAPIRGDTETYSIDLRDYDWEQGPFPANGVSFADAWEAIAGNTPYAVEFQGDQAENAILLTSTLFPVLFADAVADAATLGNVYYGVIGIPQIIDELDAALSIDRAGDAEQGIVVRGGFHADGRDFIAERHEQPIGGLYYWQTADFGPRAGDLFEDPLGALRGESEVVFSLPNGLLGFALYDASGERLEVSGVLSDGAQAADTYLAPRSPLRRYAQGFSLQDEVRQSVAENPIDYAQFLNIDEVFALYPANLTQIVVSDAQVPQIALAAAGLPQNLPEPISVVLDAFDGDVDLLTAAGDLLLPPDQLQNETNRLDPALSGLDNGFTVDRGDWGGLYVSSLCVVTIASENRPSERACIDAGALQ